MTYYLGIDIGKNGAIAVFTDDEYVDCLCFNNSTEKDVADFLSNISINPDIMFDGRVMAMVERVSASPQMGVVSSFSFGQSFGFILGLLTGLNISFDFVRPQVWQKALGCLTKGDKNVSKQKAQQLFPGIKITHGNADSILIAEYLRRSQRS
ncbi:hypothetical protein M0R04_09305 [Candidatus Dojkabacteria bacterium]|jgi:hypothetical protein|nr:hypothetical protein [Candidatus Dojkabacteria bacterium]